MLLHFAPQPPCEALRHLWRGLTLAWPGRPWRLSLEWGAPLAPVLQELAPVPCSEEGQAATSAGTVIAPRDSCKNSHNSASWAGRVPIKGCCLDSPPPVPCEPAGEVRPGTLQALLPGVNYMAVSWCLRTLQAVPLTPQSQLQPPAAIRRCPRESAAKLGMSASCMFTFSNRNQAPDPVEIPALVDPVPGTAVFTAEELGAASALKLMPLKTLTWGSGEVSGRGRCGPGPQWHGTQLRKAPC